MVEGERWDEGRVECTEERVSWCLAGSTLMAGHIETKWEAMRSLHECEKEGGGWGKNDRDGRGLEGPNEKKKTKTRKRKTI